MSPQIALRASARILLGLTLVITALPFASSDAEAGRIRGSAVSAGSAAVRYKNRESAEKDAQEEHATPEDATAVDGGEANGPVRAQAVVKAKPAKVVTRKDIDVPGCSPGMICTVCLAGCSGAVNVIVHAVPKQK